MARKPVPPRLIEQPAQPPRKAARKGAMDPAKNDGAERYSATDSGAAAAARQPSPDTPSIPPVRLPAVGNPGHEIDARHPGDTIAGSDGTPPAQQSQR
jgi:hypothetical protein